MRHDDRGYSLERSNGQSRGIVPLRDLDNSRMLHANELGYAEPEQEAFELFSLVRILFSRKWMILAICIVGIVASFALTLRVTPLYVATATMEIQREEVQILEGSNVGPEIVADATYMETQYRLLRSRFLAERVAEELNLIDDPRYANPNSSRESRVLQAAQRVVYGVRVSASGKSRVINVSYVSAYPSETARIANAVVEVFIQSNLERKYNTTAFAREFLDERLATAKTALEASERDLVRYAEEQELLDIAGGSTLDESSIMALNSELSTAEGDRIRAEQEYLAAAERSTSKELLDSTNLDRLRSLRSELKTDYEEMLGQFKPDFPDMVKLQARINAVEAEIETESQTVVTNVLSTLRSNFDAAEARESSLRDRVSELRAGLQDERNRRIQYRILQREVETLRSQYEALLQRSKEVSIASGIGSSNVSMVDSALVPGRPFEPNLNRALLQGFILSLAFAAALTFVLHLIDDTIKSPEDVRSKLGLPPVGVIPKMARKSQGVVTEIDDPKSQISEAFASATTSLEFATEEGVPKSLLITSTRPGEGKTSTTIALATVFAKGGKRVLIIDGDMRKPSFVVDSKKTIGLSGLLTGHDLLQDHVIETNTDGLSILPAGVMPPNPAQLLSGQRLRDIVEAAEQLYDIVIVDSPPVLSFTDSPRLGSVVDAALVVVQSGLIRTRAAKRTLTQLYDARANLLGVVLTKFDAKKAGYEYSYYYSSYGSDARAYVENNSRKDAKRKILIEAAEQSIDDAETERWA